MPEGSLGKEYVTMLNRCKISPDTRVPVKFIDGEENQFIMMRYRQIHDILHLLLDAPTNFEGESLVKAFEFQQTGLLVPFIGATAAPLYRLNSKKWSKHQSRVRKLQKNKFAGAPHYLSIYYENRWDQEIQDLKNELKIPKLF